jgi:hypothetical protein
LQANPTNDKMAKISRLLTVLVALENGKVLLEDVRWQQQGDTAPAAGFSVAPQRWLRRSDGLAGSGRKVLTSPEIIK